MSRYGENVSKYERLIDEANWKIQFHRALITQDYTLIRELLKEALDEKYDLPNISDPVVKLILQQLTNNS